MGVFDELSRSHLIRERERRERIISETTAKVNAEERAEAEGLLKQAEEALSRGEYEKADELARKGYIVEVARRQFEARQAFGI